VGAMGARLVPRYLSGRLCTSDMWAPSFSCRNETPTGANYLYIKLVGTQQLTQKRYYRAFSGAGQRRIQKLLM
jgi:hypothetical protein